MSSEDRPHLDARDAELFALEDAYIKNKLEALGSLADACAVTRRFVAENGDTALNMTFRSPNGELFNVDLLPYLPDMILQVAKIHYKQLGDVNKGPHARQVLRRVEKKWQSK